MYKWLKNSSCPVLCLTVVPPPGEITFLSVKPNSVILSWECPKGLEGPASFRVMWGSMKMTGCLVIRGFHKIEINKLQLGQKYFFRVATEDKDGNLSECVEASVVTGNKKDVNTFHVSFTALCSYFIHTRYFFFQITALLQLCHPLDT